MNHTCQRVVMTTLPLVIWRPSVDNVTLKPSTQAKTL